MMNVNWMWWAQLVSALGAMNWGLKAFLNLDLVAWVHSLIRVRNLNKLLYGFIGIAGIASLYCLLMHAYMM